jgi:hypothetical protein
VKRIVEQICRLAVTARPALVLGLALAAPPGEGARAQDAPALVAKHLYAGTLAEGDAELAALVRRQPNSGAARFGLGSIRFVRAVERLAQGLHRHGLQAPRTLMLPMLRLPVPHNPNPAPLSYAGFRAILEQFAADLARAESALAEVGPLDAKLTFDLARVRLDLDGDGSAREDERLWSILGVVAPQSRGVGDTFTVAFDEGDVPWLRGYSHLLMAIAEFWLAHEFVVMFDHTFHLFFPRAQLPFAAALGAERASADRPEYPVIADAIAFIHLWNWPVVEPARLQRAHAHLKAVAAMSRRSWAAILAESDDEHEWIPNPRQTNQLPALPVTQERVDAWLGVLGELDAVLDGTKLVPHWRFQKGINLKRALLEHKTFDPVLWIAGPGVVPFLQDGPIITGEAWTAIVRTFQGNFLGYAAWFN